MCTVELLHDRNMERGRAFPAEVLRMLEHPVHRRVHTIEDAESWAVNHLQQLPETVRTLWHERDEGTECVAAALGQQQVAWRCTLQQVDCL